MDDKIIHMEFDFYNVTSIKVLSSQLTIVGVNYHML